jgi:hypothetical protein
MSSDTNAATTRANRHGDPCPRWCTATHGHEIIPEVFDDSHRSDPIGTSRDPQDPDVQVIRHGCDYAKPEVMVTTIIGNVTVSAGHEAEQLAEFVTRLARLTPLQFEHLAEEIRVASSILLEEEQ